MEFQLSYFKSWKMTLWKYKWKWKLCPTLCDPMDLEFSSPWNPPGQNTGVGSLSLLQGIFPTQGSNAGHHIADGIFTSWATRDAQEYWSVWPVPSPVDLPNPGIEPGFLALQTDSLPPEVSGKPDHRYRFAQSWGVFQDMTLRVSWEAGFSVLKPGQINQINR